MTSTSSCPGCGPIRDAFDVDDPWDRVDEATPEYRREVEALDQLQRVPGQSGLANDSVKRCPRCGTCFLWEYSTWHFGDRDHLSVQRLTGERAERLRPLIESDDEPALREALLAAFSHADAGIVSGAEFVFDHLLYWKLHGKPTQLRLLAALASAPAPAARAYGLRLLEGWARSDRKTAEQVAVALDGVNVDATEAARVFAALATHLGPTAGAPKKPR